MIITKWTHSLYIQTLWIQVSNSMEYETNEKKKLKLVDIPGNDRIRKSELEKYKVIPDFSTKHMINRYIERCSWNRLCCQFSNNFKWDKGCRWINVFDFDRLYDSFKTTKNTHCSKSTRRFVGQSRHSNRSTYWKRTSFTSQDSSCSTQGRCIFFKFAHLKFSYSQDTDENAKTEIYLGTKNSSSFSFSQLPNDIEGQLKRWKDSILVIKIFFSPRVFSERFKAWYNSQLAL